MKAKSNRANPVAFFILYKLLCNYSDLIRKTAANAAQVLLIEVTSPYKIAVLYECKHSQRAILHQPNGTVFTFTLPAGEVELHE